MSPPPPSGVWQEASLLLPGHESAPILWRCQWSEGSGAGYFEFSCFFRPVQENDRAYRGFNLFDPDDEQLFRALARGEFNIKADQVYQNIAYGFEHPALAADQPRAIGRPVQVHSFASQGFTYSDQNNYLTMPTSDGSFAFTGRAALRMNLISATNCS